jgi:Protein of unknown function (DUF3592)
MDSNETIMTLLLLCIGMGFILLFFGGGGGWALYLGQSDKKKAAASKDWRSTPGKIVSSQIKEVTVRDSDGTRTSLQLSAEYEYSVDGIQYINNKRTPGRIPKGIPYRKATEVANQYAVGVIVPIYYNPANPQESCLEREAPLSNLTTIIGIILLVITACGLCIFGTLLVNAIRYMISG